ncbi:hypothetical protein CDD81_4722 [Ophiocordyceps australis]|uniref:Uncharacterized protein n=1 Tax=Ophiocordyceps australis TaxID=1399860 RepID=A0A2C5Y4E1_9HYPO|nr:hypothetical protein CDD81_4722 [Ophiocordyceps australis]
MFFSTRVLLINLAIFAAKTHATAHFEALWHSAVEYVPGLGTIYSFERSLFAAVEGEAALFWASLADCVESVARDVFIVAKVTEPAYVVMLHSIAEAFGEKVIEVYHKRLQEVPVSKPLDPGKAHVLVAESTAHEHGRAIFEGQGKGVFYFFNSTFYGTLRHPHWASQGSEVQLRIRQGLYNGAPVLFTWEWNKDAPPGGKRPMAVKGHIQLYSDIHVPGKKKHTTFDVVDGTVFGSREPFEIFGIVVSKDSLRVCMLVQEDPMCFNMNREVLGHGPAQVQTAVETQTPTPGQRLEAQEAHQRQQAYHRHQVQEARHRQEAHEAHQRQDENQIEAASPRHDANHIEAASPRHDANQIQETDQIDEYEMELKQARPRQPPSHFTCPKGVPKCFLGPYS